VPEFDLELFKEVLTGGVYDESGWRVVGCEPVGEGASWRARVRHGVLRVLERRLNARGLTLVRRAPLDVAERTRGADWPFIGYTMIGRLRLDHLQQCLETVLAEGVPGDFIETGVWRGGACMLAKRIFDLRGAGGRVVWVADSFRGLPPPQDAADGADLSGNPFLAIPVEQVRKNFARFGLLDEQVRFLEGWFADTLPRAPIRELAVLRLDGDLYHSTRDALVNLYDRVAPGGFVIVDDYGSWPACRRAVDEFLAARGETPSLQVIDYTGVCWRKARR
jgi:hypothetical protein